MSNYSVNIQRDSVCAGDDIEAPHSYAFAIQENALLKDIFDHLATESYLPSVSGVNHFWEAIIGIKIVAVFKGNNKTPESSDNLLAPVSSCVNDGQIDMYFKYHSAPD